MEILEIVKDSPFCNTYGGLSLNIGVDGEKYLVMEDCCYDSYSYFGPLTEEQIAAFYLLCNVHDVQTNGDDP